MPIYEYKCSSCGHKKEVLQKMSDAPLKECPACGKSTLTKLMSAAGFQLKGSGWYATDFKGGSKAAKPGQDQDDGGSKVDGKSGDEGRTGSESKASDESQAKGDNKAKGDQKAQGDAKTQGDAKAQGETKGKGDNKPKGDIKPKEEPKSDASASSAGAGPAAQ